MLPFFIFFIKENQDYLIRSARIRQRIFYLLCFFAKKKKVSFRRRQYNSWKLKRRVFISLTVFLESNFYGTSSTCFGCIVIAYWNLRLNIVRSPSLYFLFNSICVRLRRKAILRTLLFVNNRLAWTQSVEIVEPILNSGKNVAQAAQNITRPFLRFR